MLGYQATDRAYRIGQTNDVFVYCPTVVSNEFVTFDAKLDQLLTWKRDLSKDMLNGAGDLSTADFGEVQDVDGTPAFRDDPLTEEDLSSLDPDAFEALCAIIWSKIGFPRTYRTPRTNDGGIDVVGLNGSTGVLIQCKSSQSETRELGWEAVKDVVAGAAAYRQFHTGVTFSLIAATNQHFNEGAKRQAASNNVELIDRDRLAPLLKKHPLKRSEISSLALAT